LIMIQSVLGLKEVRCLGASGNVTVISNPKMMLKNDL
jgi:hypothetical protein